MSTAKKHRIGHPEKLGLVTRAWHRDDADEQSTVVIPSALPPDPVRLYEYVHARTKTKKI